MKNLLDGNRHVIKTSWGSWTDIADLDGLGFEKVRELLAKGKPGQQTVNEEFYWRFQEFCDEHDSIYSREIRLKGIQVEFKDATGEETHFEAHYGRSFLHIDRETDAYVLMVPCTRKFAKQFVKNVGSKRDFYIENTYNGDIDSNWQEIKNFLMGVKFTALKNRANRGQSDDINAPGYCQAYSADPELVQKVC